MEELRLRLRQFARERDWEQFHTPKNLVMALSVEVAEITEHFQWLTGEESRRLSPEKLAQIQDEMGDAFVYLIMLADKLGINLVVAANAKIDKNEAKYPVEKSRGSSAKYTEHSR